MQDVDLKRRTAWVIDHPRSSTDIPFDTLRTTWSGEALLLSPEELVPEAEVRVPGTGWLTWRNVGIAVGVAVLLAAAVYLIRRRLAD
jgi:hypothetical protein